MTETHIIYLLKNMIKAACVTEREMSMCECVPMGMCMCLCECVEA